MDPSSETRSGNDIINNGPSITVLSGGLSGERSVSLQSGQAIADALNSAYSVQSLCMDAEALPEHRSAVDDCLPALHGGFGEDGGLQALVEDAGIVYRIRRGCQSLVYGQSRQ